MEFEFSVQRLLTVSSPFYINFITEGLSGMLRTVEHVTLILIIKIFTVKVRRSKIVKQLRKKPSCVIDHEYRIPTNYVAMYR